MTDGSVYEGAMADWMPHGRGRLVPPAAGGADASAGRAPAVAGLFEDGVLVRPDG